MDGAVVGLQGGTDGVREILEELEALDAPVAAVWLQDWVGQRKTSFGTQLWWNWELDRDHYPDWDSLGESLKTEEHQAHDLHQPFLCDDVAQENHHRNLFEEAAGRATWSRTVRVSRTGSGFPLSLRVSWISRTRGRGPGSRT